MILMTMNLRFFRIPVDLNKPEDFMREDLIAEAFKAHKVAVNKNGTSVAFIMDNWIGLAHTQILNDVKVVEFDFISRGETPLRYSFFMNATSVKALGDLFRKLPRFDYDEIFKVELTE